ncbi:hypothetical protein DFH09DRAFT_960490 [Mycena vulgaris]|nr:hypothetical protein DFH09DRAFT_960490 [Mycena vulgaris]
MYEIRPRSSKASSPSILLESAAAVLYVVRSGSGDLESIIRDLAQSGGTFYPSWPRPALHNPFTPPSQLTLGRRPAGYTPTLVDYGVYTQHRDAFLRSSRGCAALFYGGIVGRLARLVISDYEDVACFEPTDDILKAGTRIASGNGEKVLWHEALTKDEIDLICGVYMVETDGHQFKFISWWPTPTAFWSSGLNTGWWNANCERWFVKRLKEMQSTRVKLHTYTEWKSKIRFSTAARKVAANYEKLAAEYLAARLL